MTDFESNNSWVDTGKPVTLSDVLDYEMNLRVEASEKHEQREDKKELSQTKAALALRQRWLKVVQDELEMLLETERQKAKGVTKKEWFEQLNKVHTHKLADAAISIMFDATQREWSERTTEEALGRTIGTLVFQSTMDYNADARRKLRRLETKVAKMEGFDGPGRAERLLEFANKHGFASQRWTDDPVYRSKHGAPLRSAVLKTLPELFVRKKEKRDKDSNKTKYIMLTDETNEELNAIREEALNYLTTYLGPMICPPRQWSKENLGPYWRQEKGWQVPVVRHMGPEQKAEVEQGKRDGSLNAVLEAVNAVQEVPYAVNQYVVDAIKWAKSHMDKKTGANPIGSQIGGFPNTETIKTDPKDIVPPDDFKKLPKKVQIMKARKLAAKSRHNLRAKAAREICNRMVGKADEMLKFERFWLPHNLDYRGRVYPVPDFGHHNTDFVRAMFEFSNRKLVTEDNEGFLMLQLANTAGQDKGSLDERLAWVEKNKADIIAAGKDFKSTVKFWGGQDKTSFQFLAACRDWAMYQEAKAAGEPYKSGLPVAMDATQSGVQHFAAAGLSKEEGEKVNLRKSERPSDFYELCLKRAIGLILDDLSENTIALNADPINDKEQEIIDAHEALELGIGINEYPELDELEREKQQAKDKTKADKKFRRTTAYKKLSKQRDIEVATIALDLYQRKQYTRNHIKRNAMVFCYSSKEYGMAEQLNDDWMKKLAEEVFDKKLNEHPFGEDEGFYAARYLARKHYAAISKEVTSAAKGMEFFQNVAALMAQDGNGHIKFKNRLDFPMFQNYREVQQSKHKVLGMDTETFEYNPDSQSYYTKYKDTIDPAKSCSAIAPNMIHQQDSLHLMMTVLDCLDNGVSDFMFVHDSYATTAADAKVLAECTRRQFIDLYSNYNLYEDFLAQCKARHSNPDSVEWPEPPKPQDLDITDVWESDYFFS